MRPLPIVVVMLALAGCPLPQPLPEVQRTGSTVTPPRILVDTALPADAVVRVRPDCVRGQVIPFSATLEDLDLDDTVEVRWFVDWSLQRHAPSQIDFPPASTDATNPLRAVRPLSFEPALDAADGAPHVVEMVVSNGFQAVGTAGVALPDRTPLPGYETQVFRWFVMPDAAGSCE